MPCWSTWAYDAPLPPQLASPQLRPPSSDRNQSTPAAHTRFGSRGSTASTLLYQPMVVGVTGAACGLHTRLAALAVLVRRSVLRKFGSALLTRVSHDPARPPRSLRYTASRPCR